MFISADQFDKLKDLVIIYPRWMITIMKKIVELDHEINYDNILPISLKSLGDFGIADKKLLQERWKEDVTEKVKLDNICSIMQAYCLLIPIVIQCKDAPESAENIEKYLIPCKIPDIAMSEDAEHFDFSVFFDFDKFLPVVVYHRLISRLVLLACDSKEKHCFSKSECIIREVDGLEWWIKFKSTSYCLEISLKG